MHSVRDHKLTEMLKRARDQFQMYGDHHMAKPQAQIEKASVNYGFVADINEVLLQPVPTIIPSGYQLGEAGYIPPKNDFDTTLDAFRDHGNGVQPLELDQLAPGEDVPLGGDGISLTPPDLAQAQVDEG